MLKLNRHVTGAAGLVSALVGVGLFVVFALVSLNYYDEKPRPWWLVSLFVVAIGLVLVPILGALLVSASRALSTRGHRRTEGRS